MNIVIIACFTASHRLEYIIETLKEANHNVIVIKSNFNHMTKKEITDKNDDYIYIDAKKYKKNLSFNRIYSHYDFANKVLKKLEVMQPDIIYSLVPPNSLANNIIKYKYKNPNVKVIFDIIDLWPETLPFGKLKKILIFPLYFWRKLRDKNLKKADYVVTECELYKKILSNRLPNNTSTIHLVEKYVGYHDNLNNEIFEICYLGSINNIIDLDLIIEALCELKKYKKIKLNIIGDGEKREQLIKMLQEKEIPYEFYGKIFDDQMKSNILDRCRLGINFMKDSVCVGLTMKSIEYFRFGLPILNNIKEDTTNIVQHYKVGFNINRNNLKEVVNQISSMEQNSFIKLKENVSNMYKNEFEIKILKNKIKNIIGEIV